MQTTPRRSPAHPPPRQPWPPQPATASVRAEDLPVARSRLPRELSSSCTVSVAQRRCSSQRRRSPAHGAGAPRRARRPALPNASAAVVALPPCVSLEAGGCPPPQRCNGSLSPVTPGVLPAARSPLLLSRTSKARENSWAKTGAQ